MNTALAVPCVGSWGKPHTWQESKRSSPARRAGESFHSLLQGIFPTQGLNQGLPPCRQILYSLSHQGSPKNYSAILKPTSVIHSYIYLSFPSEEFRFLFLIWSTECTIEWSSPQISYNLYSTFQFGTATFQGVTGQLWLVATTGDSPDRERFYHHRKFCCTV